LDPVVEDVITAGIQKTEHGTYLSVDPDKVQAILGGLQTEMEKFGPTHPAAGGALLAGGARHFRPLVERFVPTLVVLSHNELVPELNVHSLGVVHMAGEKERDLSLKKAQ
jgi:flagellar biosynthesis protein FlhA